MAILRPTQLDLLPLLLLVLLAPCAFLSPAAAQETGAEPPAEEVLRPTERPFLWEIEGPTPSYLYGTIHVPDERVVLLPEVVEAALERADAFYAELALDPKTQFAAAMKAMLPAGQRLKDILPAELHGRVVAYLERREVPAMLVSGLDRMKVWAVQMTLATADLGPDLMKQALDALLYQRAVEAEKAVGGLETLEEQVGVFEGFTQEEQIQMLEETLEQLEEYAARGESQAEKLIVAYLEGDIDALFEMMMSEFDPEDELGVRLMEKLLWERNERMAERILARLEAAPGRSHFFAVGAAHYPGERGILELLEEAGKEVRLLRPADLERVRGEPVGSGK